MSAVLKFDASLETHTCGECGIIFAAPVYFWTERREKGGGWFCPNGHSRVFSESQVQKLQKQLEQERSRVEFYKHEAENVKTTLRGANIQLGKTKAQLRRTTIRIGNGVCPCCNRQFQNLHRHMTNKHPDYKAHEAT